MRNNIYPKIENKVKMEITGINVYNYFKRNILNEIDIMSSHFISPNKIILTIKYRDYKKLKKTKSIYKIKIIKKYGTIYIKEKIKTNIALILSIFIGIIYLYFLSNTIFEVEVEHQSKNIRNLISNELQKYGIEKYHFAKSFKEQEIIKKKILNDTSDYIEWMSIERVGSKYIIKVIEKNKTNFINNTKDNIIVNKNCIISKIFATSGEKIKEINNYVKKGEVVISGEITLASGEKLKKQASGKVYGLVWYKVEINYPIATTESSLTNSSYKELSFNFLSYTFPYKRKYKNYKTTSLNIIKNDIFNIGINLNTYQEQTIKNIIYTQAEAKEQAITYVLNKLKDKEKNIQNIKEVKIIKEINNNDNIYLKLFIETEELVGE